MKPSTDTLCAGPHKSLCTTSKGITDFAETWEKRSLLNLPSKKLWQIIGDTSCLTATLDFLSIRETIGLEGWPNMQCHKVEFTACPRKARALLACKWDD